MFVVLLLLCSKLTLVLCRLVHIMHKCKLVSLGNLLFMIALAILLVCHFFLDLLSVMDSLLRTV